MEEPKKSLESWSDESAEYEVFLSSDDLECYLSIVPSQPGSLSVAELKGVLQRQGVVFGLDDAALEEASRKLAAGLPVVDLLVALGNAPVDASATTVSFDVLTYSETPRYARFEDGTVDYHHANLFENVLTGMQIGVIQPMSSGEDGCSVLGVIVLAASVEEAEPPKAGDGVELTEDGRFIATADGRVIFENDVISVSGELVINDDVDYGCGDLDFVGHVHVKGSVREGYCVRGRKGVVIDHVAENARIDSDGDIRVGGITGDGENCQIRCGGNLLARYLHEVYVECFGDVIVSGEIMNCHLRVGGSIQASMLSGGTSYAGAGFEVRRLGNDAGSPTYIRAGIGLDQVEQLEEADIQLEAFLKQQARLLELLEGASEEESEKIQVKLEHLSALIEVYADRWAKACESDSEFVNAKVNVKKCIFDGVTIHLGHAKRDIREYSAGAYSIIEHEHFKLVFLPLTPLEINAREMEKELLRKERKR